MKGTSLITIILIGILVIPQAVANYNAEEARDMEYDPSDTPAIGSTGEPIWPMENGNPKRNGTSVFSFGDNPGKIKKTFTQELHTSPVIDSEGVIY